MSKKKSCSNCFFKNNKPKDDDNNQVWDPCESCGDRVVNGVWVPENWVDQNKAQQEEQ